jgi:TPR repeat protein
VVDVAPELKKTSPPAKPRKSKTKTVEMTLAAANEAEQFLDIDSLGPQECFQVEAVTPLSIATDSQNDAKAERSSLPETAALHVAPPPFVDEVIAAEAGEVAPPSLREFVFDPFRESETEAWAPPSEEEFDAEFALEIDDAPAPISGELSIEQDVPAPPVLCRPEAVEDLSASVRDRHAYLAKARLAAQSNVTPPEKSYIVMGLEFSKSGGVALAAASGLALSLLTVGLTMNAPRGATAPTPLAPGPAEAAALTTVQSSTAHTEAYALAMRHLGAGEARTAANILRSAADAGFAPAQYQLAKLFESGEGVGRDITQARTWTERAARAGHCRAMHDTGVYYARGEGAPLDEAAAYRWFHQAALLGVADSQFNLGVLYQQGRGVRANASEALFWFLLAARNGDGDAVDRAVELATQLSPQDVARARSRARAFEPERAVDIGDDRACAASAVLPGR